MLTRSSPRLLPPRRRHHTAKLPRLSSPLSSRGVSAPASALAAMLDWIGPAERHALTLSTLAGLSTTIGAVAAVSLVVGRCVGGGQEGSIHPVFF